MILTLPSLDRSQNQHQPSRGITTWQQAALHRLRTGSQNQHQPSRGITTITPPNTSWPICPPESTSTQSRDYNPCEALTIGEAGKARININPVAGLQHEASGRIRVADRARININPVAGLQPRSVRIAGSMAPFARININPVAGLQPSQGLLRRTGSRTPESTSTQSRDYNFQPADPHGAGIRSQNQHQPSRGITTLLVQF